MTESAANYNDLVTAWGVEKIRTRFVLIFSAAEAFLDRHALSDQRLNESFAVALMISMVFDTAKIIHHDGWSRYNRFSYLLNYFFSYRAVNPQALELILYALAVRPIYERLC
jgi:hypothetical protein